jgi:hypothetical protein
MIRPIDIAIRADELGIRVDELGIRGMANSCFKSVKSEGAFVFWPWVHFWPLELGNFSSEDRIGIFE